MSEQDGNDVNGEERSTMAFLKNGHDLSPKSRIQNLSFFK